MSGIGITDTSPEVPFSVDLFKPPLHIRHLAACVALKQEEPQPSLAKIADRLRINRMTAKRALDYARLMQQSGTEDPHVEIHVRPVAASRWRT